MSETSGHRPQKRGGEHQIIHVPNTLRAKAGAGTGIDPGLVKAAEKVVEDMAVDFRAWATEDLRSLAKLVADTPDHAGDLPGHFNRIFDLAHDLKGQGGTFGYSLLTAIADNLCRFIERLARPTRDHVPVIEAHVDALRAILHYDVKGLNDPTGREIMTGLQILVEKAHARG